MKKYLFLFSCVCLFISCNSAKSSGDKPIKGSIEGSWKLTYIDGTKIRFESLYPNEKPEINFNINDTKVTGKNGCNNFGGNFSLDGMTIAVDQKTLISTKMFCEGAGEKTFMDALAKINNYSISEDGKTLNLLKGKSSIMQFEKI